MKGWMWPRWWKTTLNVRPLFGIVPSSGSVADPEKLIVLPARKCDPSTGWAIVGCGARPTGGGSGVEVGPPRAAPEGRGRGLEGLAAAPVGGRQPCDVPAPSRVGVTRVGRSRRRSVAEVPAVGERLALGGARAGAPDVGG